MGEEVHELHEHAEEAHHDPGLGKLVPARDWGTLSGIFPTLRERFRSFTWRTKS